MGLTAVNYSIFRANGAKIVVGASCLGGVWRPNPYDSDFFITRINFSQVLETVYFFHSTHNQN